MILFHLALFKNQCIRVCVCVGEGGLSVCVCLSVSLCQSVFACLCVYVLCACE